MFEQYYLNEDGETVYFHKEHGMRFEWMRPEDIHIPNGYYKSPIHYYEKIKNINENVVGFCINSSKKFNANKTKVMIIADDIFYESTSITSFITRGYSYRVVYTKENILYYSLKFMNKNKNDSDDYSLVSDNIVFDGRKTKLCYIHICGKTIPTSITNVQSNSFGCRACANKNNIEKNHRFSQEFVDSEVLNAAKRLNIIILNNPTYINNRTTYKIKCGGCNKPNEVSFMRLTSEKNPYTCSCKRRTDSDSVVIFLTEHEENEDITVSNKHQIFYGVNKTTYDCVCNKCNHNWSTKYSTLFYRKTGCPKCNGREAKCITRDIDPYFDTVEPEKQFSGDIIGKLRYDRYVDYLNMLLEYDGKQHFTQTEFYHKADEQFVQSLKRDKIKTEYAINNGYNFIRIAYYEDHDQALGSFLKLVLQHSDKQVVQIYGEVQILDKQ